MMRSTLGYKGSRLSEIFRMGLPVPPGLVISTEVCSKYFERNRTYLPELQEQVREKLEIIEKSIGQRFGNERDPLLLSVRPSAEVQMPGTIKDLINVGLNDKSVVGLSRISGSERFAYDLYRKFIEEFAVRTMNIHPNRFQAAREKLLKAKSIKKFADMSALEIKLLIQEYMKIVSRYTGRKFPQDSEEQLWMVIDSVYNDWRSEKVSTYRRMNDLAHLEGTGLTIQKMVFGNLNNKSGAGRVFTRNPITGEKGMYGEYVMNNTLESILDGSAIPRPITDMKIALPKVYEQINEYHTILEKHFQDVQDIQFAIENEMLYFLHSKNAKLGASAEVKTAVDLVKEGIITENISLKNIYAPLLGHLHHKVVDPMSVGKITLLGKGISGSRASATGHALFNKDKVESWRKAGKNVILITKEATTENYPALRNSNGYITASGGTVSDAAILVRERSIASVLSCGDLDIDLANNKCRLGSTMIKEGDIITVNGLEGEIYAGEVPLTNAEITPEYDTLMKWVDARKQMKVLVNANTPEDVALGMKYGAEGIGLCKTEHMLDAPSKLKQIRRALLAETLDERKRILEELAHVHKEDFKSIFKIVNGKPYIIRILDPPLHTFIPGDAKSQAELAKSLEISVDVVEKTHAKLAEYNPTLGLRGSRLAFMYPEIVQFQVKSIFMAAMEAIEEGLTPMPYIELPMISSAKEFTIVKQIIEGIAGEIGAQDKIKYKVGLLIEIPRAALAADELAKVADFMHFGTNDLTQLACGFSQEDSQTLIEKYVEKGVYAKNPFISLDMTGVGELMKISIEKARKVRKNMKFGISGTHAADPVSIGICQKMGVDEISCSAHLIPVAKVASAQAVL